MTKKYLKVFVGFFFESKLGDMKLYPTHSSCLIRSWIPALPTEVLLRTFGRKIGEITE